MMLSRLVARVSILAVLMILSAFGGAAHAAHTRAPMIELNLWAAGYTPSRLLPNTPANSSAPKIQGIDPVVAAYERLHPNVKINLIKQPTDGARTWMITQLTAGTAPDIMWDQPDWAAEDYRKNWLVPLDPYLAKPNPYVAGNRRWGDMFLPAIQVWRAADNHLYVALADQVQVAIYYNKDIFQKAGISQVPPRTWEDLMTDARKIRDAGFYPFAESGNNLDQLTWVSGWLTNFFYAPLVKKFDLNGDGVLNKTEMATAVLNGGYSFLDVRNKARLTELKRFSTYWQPGALAATPTIANKAFVTGRAGMIVTGSWLYETFKKDPLRRFNFGVFYFPVLNSRTSSLIPNGVPPTNKAAGYGSFQFVVTNSAMKNKKSDQAMDFLMFATAPKNLSPMITEGGFALPAVKGATPNPDLAPFQESVSYKAAPFQEDDSMFDYEFAQKFLAITSQYINESMSLDAASQSLQKYALEAAHRVLGK